MYAVIFTAKTKEVDSEYLTVAKRMRDLATEKYGCVDFVSISEGEQELTISYWPSRKHIEKWKNDPEHIKGETTLV